MNPIRSKLSLAAAFAAVMLLAACDNNGDDETAPLDDAAGIDVPAPVPDPEPAPAAPVPAPAPGGASAAVPEPASAAFTEGEQIFAAVGCAGCHGVDGGGGIGPTLAGNQNVNDAAHVVTQILRGGETMPPFDDRLTNEEVAAVANYLRGAWGNTAAELVTPVDVEAARGTAP